MGDWGGDSGARHLVLAENLGLAMARRAADILERHRRRTARPAPGDGARPAAAFAADDAAVDDAAFAADDAIFTAVLDATNDCLGRFDPRPAEDRWCDALLHLLLLARPEAP